MALHERLNIGSTKYKDNYSLDMECFETKRKYSFDMECFETKRNVEM